MIKNNFDVIRPIRSNDEYEAFLKEIERLWDFRPDSPEGEKCEILCLVVEDYEKKNYTTEVDFDPVDVISFWMEQNSLSRKDLEKYIGHRGRVAEVLGRKRSLSISMIRNLTNAGIPAELLVKEIKPGRRPKVKKAKASTKRATKQTENQAHP